MLQAAIRTTEFAEDADRRVCCDMRMWQRLENVMEGTHQIAEDWAKGRVQELRRQAVNAQFKRSKTLHSEFWSST